MLLEQWVLGAKVKMKDIDLHRAEKHRGFLFCFIPLKGEKNNQNRHEQAMSMLTCTFE